MKTLLDQWRDDIFSRTSVSFPSTRTVVGERKAHIGPRSQFAIVSMRFEPSASFSATLVEIGDDVDRSRFATHAIFGAIDVRMIEAAHPVSGVRISVESLETHPIDSSEMAFRWAGRDAARKALAFPIDTSGLA